VSSDGKDVKTQLLYNKSDLLHKVRVQKKVVVYKV
jgi:hypothetical protein